MKADLYADGFATVIIKAINQETDGDLGVVAVTKKLCELNLEPDPQYGDYATGDCDKL